MRLTKHHGLGNDFLVLLDLDDSHPVSPEMAVALCDRRTGLGADGLLRATPGTRGADVTMELFNADGSVAEMSGNGVRCLAQAVFQSGPLKQTGRLMVKDENVCLHCGLCAERCPTYAWDMRKFVLELPYAGSALTGVAS